MLVLVLEGSVTSHRYRGFGSFACFLIGLVFKKKKKIRLDCEDENEAFFKKNKIKILIVFNHLTALKLII